MSKEELKKELDFDEIRNKKIEVVSVDFSRLRMIFNQRLYEISNIEEEVTDIPYSDANKALFICNKIHPVFVKNFCAEFNAERRRKYAVYNLRTLEKFDFVQDSLFDMFTGFLQKRFNLSFTVSNKVFDETQRIVGELHQTLQKEKEESAKKKTIDEGFLYTQIHIPWALGTKIEEFFKSLNSTG